MYVRCWDIPPGPAGLWVPPVPVPGPPAAPPAAPPPPAPLPPPPPPPPEPVAEPDWRSENTANERTSHKYQEREPVTFHSSILSLS